MLILFGGCGIQPQKVQQDKIVKEPDPIAVLILNAEDLGSEIARQWAARKNGIAKVTTITADELFDNDYEVAKNHDVLIYPGHLIGQLVRDEQIVPLPDEVWNSAEYNSRGLLRDCRTKQIRYDDQNWGAPLSSPNFFLIARRDVLKAIGSDVPKTWEEFDQLARKLLDSEKELTALDLPYRIDVPVDGHYAAHTLLTFAASYVRQRGKIDFVFDRNTISP